MAPTYDAREFVRRSAASRPVGRGWKSLFDSGLVAACILGALAAAATLVWFYAIAVGYAMLTSVAGEDPVLRNLGMIVGVWGTRAVFVVAVAVAGSRATLLGTSPANTATLPPLLPAALTGAWASVTLQFLIAAFMPPATLPEWLTFLILGLGAGLGGGWWQRRAHERRSAVLRGARRMASATRPATLAHIFAATATNLSTYARVESVFLFRVAPAEQHHAAGSPGVLEAWASWPPGDTQDTSPDPEKPPGNRPPLSVLTALGVDFAATSDPGVASDATPRGSHRSRSADNPGGVTVGPEHWSELSSPVLLDVGREDLERPEGSGEAPRGRVSVYLLPLMPASPARNEDGRDYIALVWDRRRMHLPPWEVRNLLAAAQYVGVKYENLRLYRAARDTGVELGVLRERQRLAGEIHDGAKNALLGIALLASATARSVSDPTRTVGDGAAAAPEATDSGPADASISLAQTRLNLIAQTAREAAEDASRMVENLAPSAVDRGDLSHAMRLLADAWRRETDLAVDLRIEGDRIPLPTEVGAALLRVAQEAKSNIVKYAKASRTSLRLRFDGPHGVELLVEDDGVGFDPVAREGSLGRVRGGFGIRSMRKRLDDLGGTLKIVSRPDQGTKVLATVPVSASGGPEGSSVAAPARVVRLDGEAGTSTEVGDRPQKGT